MSTFRLPDLGEGLQEAEIVAWHVAEGDHVVVDQPLVSVETEKAVVEIPSPQAGHVARFLARPGERVKVGAPLLAFEEGPHAETGAVVGELAQPAAAVTPKEAAPPVAESPRGASNVRASPAIRARAQALGVDLAQVSPTGPGGTIVTADVEAAATAAGAPLRGARRTMAANMARAWREVVHATLHDEADIAHWSARLDVTVRLIRAIVAGCTAEPALNAQFDAASATLRPNTAVDLGLAIDSPEGLFVPVLQDVGRTGSEAWRSRIDAVKKGVADRSLAPADLRGATITLSNFGTIAGRHASLIIMPPQVAILGAGRIIDDPAGRRALPLSLSFDHRAVTGGEAARFLRAVIADLERAD
jgi:2-oxoisovalerate dehydrogenase E2 component (dihydrolipoyl transacylase)